MVDQATTKEEASDRAHGKATNEMRSHKGKRLLRRKDPRVVVPRRILREYLNYLGD